MKLTDTLIRSARPKGSPYKLPRELGLFVVVNPNGAKWWRFAYTFAGREKLLSLGVYPAVSLSVARERREAVRKLIALGVDPSEQRRVERAAAAVAAANTFEDVAREWLGKQQHLASTTIDKAATMLEQMAYPWIGSRPIANITAPELLTVVRRVEGRGCVETAQRLKQRCGQIFRYAIATGRAERDPSADLRGALSTTKARHHAAITKPAELAALLRDLDGYKGSFVTACALKLAPLVFVRPGELRHAEWSEIDFDAAEWRIPGEKMKMRAPHIVPLSEQAIATFRELQPLTGKGRYVFPSVRSLQRPMSENTINAALRRLGYTKDQATAHGFRTTASTRLHEMGWNSEAIERQLAHAERNQVKAAYNHAEHLPERRKMVQAWADYLDGLKRGVVVSANFSRAA